MDIRLYWEKVYWALAKRAFKRKQKTYEDWLAKGYTNQPLVSFIIESHNKAWESNVLLVNYVSTRTRKS